MLPSLTQELPPFVAQLETLVSRRGVSRPALNFWPSLAYLDLLKSQIRRLEGDGADGRAQAAIEAYEHGIALARQSEVDLARHQLIAVDADVAGCPAGLQEFLAVFGLSAWAYYYYRVEQWDAALTSLTQVLQVSVRLEHRGYYALSSRRRLTLMNMVRVHDRRGEPGGGDALLRAAVRFFHTGVARELIICDWDWQSFGRIPNLREYDFQSLVRAVVRRNTAQLTDKTHDNAYFVDFFYRELLAELAVTNHARQHLREWLVVKVTCPEQEPQAFLGRVLTFLSRPNIEQFGRDLEANLLTHVGLLLEQAPDLANRAALQQRVRSVAEQLPPTNKE